MGDIPQAAADRIARKATGFRVGADAAAELAMVLEKKGELLAREAGKYAKHAGRKTVKAEDIRLATESVH